MTQARTSTSKPKPHDAIALLTADHEKVKKLFKDFDKLKKASGTDRQKEELVDEICTELTMHMQLEEEIFYPQVRDPVDDDDLMDEAEVEHATVKDLITQLESMDADEELYDAKVIVLGEYIEHHVKEEQEEMFAKIKKANIDTVELGEQIMARRKELQED
jgi:iron-sulfur cluster repair protein YtfE (RIC family)